MQDRGAGISPFGAVLSVVFSLLDVISPSRDFSLEPFPVTSEINADLLNSLEKEVLSAINAS